jgi:hypothetical protein
LPPMTPQRHYNGIVAGEEAYIGNSARRQAELGRQYDLNAAMYWSGSGIASWYPGVFEPWPIVPGNIFGWPAAVSPPTITPTAIAPPMVVSAAVPTARPKNAAPGREVIARPNQAVMKPAPQQLPAGGNSPGGLLPGFVPTPQPADGAGVKSSGPRAF